MKKIINILSHPPTYEFYRDKPRPEVNWDTPDGKWVGIWGYDWPDQLGNEILKLTDEFEYEVWQPDLRADRVYGHRFDSGLVHYLFPASIYSVISLSQRKGVTSNLLLERLKAELNRRIIIHLNDFRGILSLQIYRLLQNTDLPLLITGHGSALLPLEEAKLARSPFTKLSLLKEHLQLKKLIKRVNYAADENQNQIHRWSAFIGRKLDYLTMGCDFNFWYPQPKDVICFPGLEKIHRENKLVFLSVANFIERKQLDKIIMTFLSLREKRNFCLVLVGHGEKDYSDYLKKVGEPLIENDQLLFVDYIRGEKLRDIYWSSDIYLSMARSEGTSVAAMCALACGLLMITTENNGIADILKKYNAGLVLPPTDYKQWKKELGEVLDGRPIKALPREIARKWYDWPMVAHRYIKIYRQLSNHLK